MFEVKAEEEKKARAFLLGLPDRPLKELEGLVHTLGMEIIESKKLVRLEVSPAYGMGSGKALEIADEAKEIEADCIIFDWEIEPTKQRNWEKLTKIPCFDRNEVILRIFAQRAQTKAARLQVDLARLKYSLPRLSHTYGDLSRQRGGVFGNKGQGETQLELDRRQIEEKIEDIKKDLAQVQTDRRTQRKRRLRGGLLSCALVGYTNAGKSTLLNTLTGASALAEDKLFATLDPTTRKLPLENGASVLLTDTVGFISNLPHTLIESFKSTLEEAALADLLLLVVDSSDPDCLAQFEEVRKVLGQIDAADLPYLIVLNKIDRVTEPEKISMLNAAFPDAVKISAKEATGLEELKTLIEENLLGRTMTFEIPIENPDLQGLLKAVRRDGILQEEDWGDSTVKIKARLRLGKTFCLLEEYRL